MELPRIALSMRQLVYAVALLLSSPLLVSSVCPEPSQVTLLRMLPRLNPLLFHVVSFSSKTLCQSNETRTVAASYWECYSRFRCSYRVAVIDVRCTSKDEWELTSSEAQPESAYESLSSEQTSCVKCVNATAARDYPDVPSGSLDYNETTHCLCKYTLCAQLAD